MYNKSLVNSVLDCYLKGMTYDDISYFLEIEYSVIDNILDLTIPYL